jgi:hypothetical protein
VFARVLACSVHALKSMSAIQQLLQRWGFVKLDHYGLALTPEGRISSTRPEILQDASGQRIVGWCDDDLAMAELSPWDPTGLGAARAAKPVAPKPGPAEVRAAASPPLAAVRELVGVAPTPGYPQVITEASVMERAAAAASAAVMVEPVAGGPVVDEDDWEWTIALARARTAVDEVASTARPASPRRGAPSASGTPSAPSAPGTMKPATSARATSRPATPVPRATSSVTSELAGQRTRPIATVATRDPAASGEWPKTETIGTIDYERDRSADPTAILYAAPPARTEVPAASTTPTTPTLFPSSPALPTRAARPTPPPPVPRPATSPVTVIPVPTLPTVQAQTGRFEPVVRSAAEAEAASLKRIAKGTGPQAPRAPSRVASSMTDDTEPNLAIGDRTTPGMAIPLAARAVELPSVKRRAAQRG